MKKIMSIFESIFSIGYLIFAFVTAYFFFISNNYLCGILVLILGIGDSFHLIPRTIRNIKGNIKDIEWWLGLGLKTSSITMTIFYIILYYIWYILYDLEISIIIPILIWITSLFRIIVCLFPQNNWYQKEGNQKWSLIRNIPFVIMGLLLIILFIVSKNYQISIAITISFLCYIPVTLFAKKKPIVGMLMIPKTIAYIWMICILFNLSK